MEIHSEYVTLNVSDGSKMQAWTARPKTPGPHPGLLVFQEAFGVNGHIRNVTVRFAREGYVSIAPEMYHRTAPAGFFVAYDNYSALAPHMSAVKRETIQADEQAAYDWLRSNIGNAPIGAVGFCMGGGLAFSAALALPVCCAISFYGGSIPAGPRGPGLLDRAASLRAPMLLFWGGLDKHITPEQVNSVTDALRAAHKPFVNVDISDADHGFMCDERSSYSPVAASQAWPLTLAFLKAHAESAEKAKTA